MIKFLVFTFICLIYSEMSYSGPSGDHMHFPKISRGTNKISKKQSIEISQQHVFRLAMKGKLDRSWLKSKVIDSYKKVFYGKDEWVIRFKNENEIVGKKLLFIFLSLKGKFIAANYSGK